MMKCALIGAGWRSRFYLEAARIALSGRLEFCCIAEADPGAADRARRQWGLPVFACPEETLAAKPDFAVLCLPGAVMPDVVCRLADTGLPLLCETWPAASMQAIAELYRAVGRSGLVQVSEQYPCQAMHSARLAVVAAGLLGQVRQAQVSVAHGYHGAALVRRYLGAGLVPCTVTARRFGMCAVRGPGREGWPAREELREETQDLTLLDFGDSWGLIDFTGEQYFSPIRGSRVLLRGARGEIENTAVRHLKEPYPCAETFFLQRQSSGLDNSLAPPATLSVTGGGKSWYQNPFGAVRLSDEETAVATSLSNMMNYVKTGREFYSLAEESQDQYLSLLIDEAIRTGRPQTAMPQVWWQA